MVKCLVLGCGRVGSEVALDLSKSECFSQVVVADAERNMLEKVSSRLGENSTILMDVGKYNALVEVLRKFDMVIGALPGYLGYAAMKACIGAGVNLIDVSYMPENPMDLADQARKSNVIAIPDCGLAPGLTNMLAGHGAAKMDGLDEIKILVGGLPEAPVPPVEYTITWSATDLIEEYTRKPRVVRNGETVEVEPLTGLETVHFPEIGLLEAFYTDGLRTMLYTFGGKVKDMCEKTLRYPGHAEKVRLLSQLGFFDSKPLEINDAEVLPKKFTAKLLEDRLRREEVPDVVVARVEVSGKKGADRVCCSFNLTDRFDKVRLVSALVRTTAYTAVATALTLARGLIRERGVVPPEQLGMKTTILENIVAELGKWNVKVIEKQE